MSDFIVSARKYRPATFASVVGQQHITSTLKNAIERGQLAHAYLFCGPRGVGKTTCARIFAKAINCFAPEGAEACNACESCRSFDEGRSLNIHELDAASNNSVEDIRSLIEQVRIIPQVGRYAVFIIDEVHMLSAAAFNAFLKTLEEPPAHAVFILATTEKHKIIPTILSRCQIYDFNRIRVEDAVGYLRYIAGEEGVEADDESLNLIAQKADGGMRDALSMFDKAVSFCGGQLRYKEVARTLNVLDYDTYFSITDHLLAGDYVAALVAFDEVLANGFSGQTFMTGLNRHLRDLLMAKSPATLRLIEMTGTLLERYRTQAAACNPAFLFGAIALLTELDGKIRQSSNQRLLVELGLMKLAGLGHQNTPAPDALPLPDFTGGTAGSTGSAATTPTGAASAFHPEQGGAGSTATVPVGTTPQPTPGPSVTQPPTAAPQPSYLQTGASNGPAAMAAAGSGSTERSNPASVPPVGTPLASTPTGNATAAPAPGAQRPATEAQPSAILSPIPTSASAQPASPTQAPHSGQPIQSAASAPLPSQPISKNPAPASRPDKPQAAARTPLVSGTSLADLISAAEEPASDDDAPATPATAASSDYDPHSQRKLEEARPRILQLMQEKRPRFVAAFELMKIEGSTIRLSVPTAELREEILRNKTAMLTRIAELAGTEGRLELEVTVNEQIRAARPIKLEDRVKHLTEKNPLLSELRKALDLEWE